MATLIHEHESGPRSYEERQGYDSYQEASGAFDHRLRLEEAAGGVAIMLDRDLARVTTRSGQVFTLEIR